MMRTLTLALLAIASASVASASEVSDATPVVTLQKVRFNPEGAHKIFDHASLQGTVSLWYFLSDDDQVGEQVEHLRVFRNAMWRGDGVDLILRVVLPSSMADRASAIAEANTVPVFLDVADNASVSWTAAPGQLLLIDDEAMFRDRLDLTNFDLGVPANRSDLEARVEAAAFDRIPHSVASR